MNQKIKKMWVSALKSGKYKQGKKALCHGGPQGSRYCCLGVLADLAVKHGGISRREAFSGNGTLNCCVLDWSGLMDDDPSVDCGGEYVCLTSLNDDRCLSFSEIATVINKNF